MGKIFGFLLIVIAVYVGLTVYDQGVDRAFGGLFARSHASAPPPGREAEREPVVSDRGDDAPSADGPRRVPITQAVRERVTGAMQEGERRQGGR
ncbi:MAG TPA: hypothetical protein VMW35_11090 [Myxococcota bacterium]|jgi:hypothetical protein|nr:hypothetical protein [Myxococcota bacterium]